MITADLADERAFAEIKRLCHTGLDPETLFRRVAEPLRRAVPFEGYAASTFDPLSGLPTGLVSNEEMGGKDDARFFVEHVYFEDDVNEYGWMARERIAVTRLSDGTGGRFERALRHRLYNAPKGFGYELRAVLAADRRPWGGLCLVRERGDRDFDEREVTFMRRVVPPLTDGLRAATLHSEFRCEPKEETSDTAGVLVLDYRGRLARYTRAAERWLRELGATEAGREDGRELPAAVFSVVGTLRQTLGSGTTGRYPSDASRLRVRGRSGRWLTLQASLTEPRPEHHAETVVVIAPAEPREVARFHTAAYGLSAREEEIAALVLRCASTREISAALYISESTVQGHISRIFGKAGVKSRRELLKRLFLDNLPE